MADERRSTVLMQARIPREIADHVASDAMVLGLDGVSDAIREGLRLLHRRAELIALAEEYDDFYGGTPAPVSDATAALFADE
ncbi:MAG TPA: hypothetical protein VF869_09465 [Jatrophihabitantaceae bacterium]|jgi:hypothetical protein